MKRTILLGLAACLLFFGDTNSLRAEAVRGIVNQPAPAWGVTQWLNLPAGKQTVDVADYEGKVLYILFFQTWCPGCHSVGFPTLKKVMSKYEGNDDVAFVTIQTVFEGFGTNTFDGARKTAKQYDLEIPVGHSGDAGVRSPLMKGYRSGGTPWVILVDQKGTVRFNDFHIDSGQALRAIDSLLANPPE